jgi:hypothetical protein
MNKAIQLDYADTRRTWSAPAIVALILGLCSGPIMVVVVRFTGIAYGISMVGSGVVVTIGTVVIIFCIWVYVRLRRQSHARGRVLALIGLIATVLWSVGLIALFCYIDSHLN